MRRLSIRSRLSDTKSNHCLASGLLVWDDADVGAAPSMVYLRIQAACNSSLPSRSASGTLGFDEGGAAGICTDMAVLAVLEDGDRALLSDGRAAALCLTGGRSAHAVVPTGHTERVLTKNLSWDGESFNHDRRSFLAVG